MNNAIYKKPLSIKRIEKLYKKGVPQDVVLRMMQIVETREETQKKEKEKNMERKYLKGFYPKKKQSKYGAFYKCAIKYDEFINNLVPNERGYVNFCIFENKEGEPYAVLDDYAELKETKEDNQVKTFDDEILF